jgi:hypothetical protein
MPASEDQGLIRRFGRRLWLLRRGRLYLLCLCGAAAIALGAVVATGGWPSVHNRSSKAVAAPPPSPAVETVTASQAAPPVQPVYGGNQAVSFPNGDPSARALLETSIPCGEGEATFFDFLSMRSLMYRPTLNISYRITVAEREYGTIISLHERPSGQHGRSLQGIPEETIYSYALDSGAPVLVDVTPARTGVSEPLFFMRSHRDAVCNGMVRFGLLRLPRMGEPWPDQPSFEERNARLRAHFANLPSRTPPTARELEVNPQPVAEITDGAMYFAEQDGQPGQISGRPPQSEPNADEEGTEQPLPGIQD